MNPELGKQTPNRRSRATLTPLGHWVARVALSGLAIGGAYGLHEMNRSTQARNSEPTEASTPATTMVPVPEGNATLWGVAEAVHDGDPRPVVDHIQKLRDGNTVVQPDQTVPVLVDDINKDPNK